MRAARQFGTAILTSIVSLALVVGGLSLALSEASPSTPPTAGPDFFPTLTVGPLLVATLTPSDTPIPATLTETPIILPPSATSTILIVPPTDTSTASATPYAFTATSQAATSRVNTAISCGPPYNWVRNYTVQPGDTLYRIALAYSTTTYELQRANCKGSSTNIAVGERLWVPNVTPQMPATSAPTYQVPTDPVTLTPLPFTSSPEPADPAAETTSDTP